MGHCRGHEGGGAGPLHFSRQPSAATGDAVRGEKHVCNMGQHGGREIGPTAIDSTHESGAGSRQIVPGSASFVCAFARGDERRRETDIMVSIGAWR